MTEDKTPLNPKEWRSWSKSQRLESVQQFRIVSPQMQRIWSDFDTAVQVSRHMDLPEPYCRFLTGVTGTGKTALVRMWRERVAPAVSSLYTALFPPSSLKSLAMRCLAALGDPQPGQGTTLQMADRLVQTLKAAETRIIFLDDAHYLINMIDSPAFSRSSADILSFLSHLQKDLNLSLVLIGLPKEAELLLQADPRFESRMQAPLLLSPYTWDASRPETIRDFCSLMHTIDQVLPLDWSDLGTEEMAARFFCATDGVLRPLMRLVRSAACQAIEEGAPTLTMKILAEAYERVLANTGIGKEKTNPFREPSR